MERQRNGGEMNKKKTKCLGRNGYKYSVKSEVNKKEEGEWDCGEERTNYTKHREIIWLQQATT